MNHFEPVLFWSKKLGGNIGIDGSENYLLFYILTHRNIQESIPTQGNYLGYTKSSGSDTFFLIDSLN